MIFTHHHTRSLKKRNDCFSNFCYQLSKDNLYNYENKTFYFDKIDTEKFINCYQKETYKSRKFVTDPNNPYRSFRYYIEDEQEVKS